MNPLRAEHICHVLLRAMSGLGVTDSDGNIKDSLLDVLHTSLFQPILQSQRIIITRSCNGENFTEHLFGFRECTRVWLIVVLLDEFDPTTRLHKPAESLYCNRCWNGLAARYDKTLVHIIKAPRPVLWPGLIDTLDDQFEALRQSFWEKLLY